MAAAMFRARRLLVIAYFVIGLVVAAQDNYLENLDNLRRVVSAVLAIVLWPLVLLGFDIRID
jgi:K+-transporting ATPase A subunit